MADYFDAQVTKYYTIRFWDTVNMGVSTIRVTEYSLQDAINNAFALGYKEGKEYDKENK